MLRVIALGMETTSLGYERIKYITEKTGDELLTYNSTIFDYDTTTTADNYFDSYSTVNLNLSNLDLTNNGVVTGDFDGDSKLDFVLYPTTGVNANKEFHLFKDLKASNTNAAISTTTALFKSIFATTWLTSSNKVSPNQGITIAQGAGRDITFKTYAYGVSGLFLENTKNITLPSYLRRTGCASAANGQNCVQAFTPSYNYASLKNYSGDFNGDGISDVIAFTSLEAEESYCSSCYMFNENCSPPGSCYNTPASTSTIKRAFFIDLKRNATTSLYNLGEMGIGSNTKVEVADFNGDGKSDLIFIITGSVNVYTLNGSNELVSLASINDSRIKIDRHILFGDYNGDGKMDFSIPQEVGSYIWDFYLSTGIGFNISSSNIGLNYVNQSFTGWNQGGIDYTEPDFFASDFNGDGKTDILKQVNYVRRCVGNIANGCDYSYDGTPHKTNFTLAENKNTTNTGALIFSSTLINIQLIGNYHYPIPVITNHNNINLNMEYGIISGSKITTFESIKDIKKDVLIKSITTGNGVKETITYKTLKNESCIDCNSVYYNSGNTESYPNTDILLAPTVKVVSQIDKISSSVHKKQQFIYYGAVSNMEGLGFLGFRATMRTNWTDINQTNLISTISKNDIGLRGANTVNYSVLGFYMPQNLEPTTNFITKTINTYNTDNVTGTFENPLQTNKVYVLKNTKSVQFNGLEGTSSVTTTEYNLENNPIQSTTQLKNGTTLEQTTVSNIGYVPTTQSPTYVVGRLASKTSTVTINSGGNNEDTSNTEELYGYSNHLLSQVQKRNTNSGVTSAYITENNIFDDWGNITKKTISYPGLADRVTDFEYDPTTHRFLIKSFDIEHLATEFTYDMSSGLLLSEKLPSNDRFNLLTTYEYDIWFKKTKIIDYLGKQKNILYQRSAEKTIVTTTAYDGSWSTETFDDLGRKITSGVKNINGNISYTSYLYDIYDRNYKTSEPYFTNFSLRWDETLYDGYGRVSQIKPITGKIITFDYSGLTTTVTETTNSGIPVATISKTKVSVKNAMGNVVSTTESNTSGTLGTIFYTYFANGGLKTTTFDGNVTTIIQDEWGRKKSLDDTSAGLYEYTYNGFGEILTEKTLKGLTTYSLDDFGKLITKTILGDLTNSITTNSYNTQKLLYNTEFKDLSSGVSAITNYDYEYDDYKRLWRTSESNPQAFYQRATIFDEFGRSSQEYYHATNNADGKSSIKFIKNTYLNGYHWQIRDNATDTMLWQTDLVNPRGQVITAQYGNSVGKVSYTYDGFGLPRMSSFRTQNGNYASETPFLSLTTTFDAQRYNLLDRNYSFNAAQENFVYDDLDRLIVYPNEVGASATQVYDNKGRITYNNLGTYKYDQSKPYRATGIKITDPTVMAYYTTRTPQIVDYNAFKRPVTISENNLEKIDFEYNSNNDRSVMYYGDNQADKNLRKYRKFYSADGSMEIKRNLATGVVEFLTYIGGDGYSAPIVLKSDSTTQNYLYLHRDYQGSIVAISNAEGQVIEKRHFDAWGSLTKYWNSSGVITIPTTAGIMLLDRGYTGHEHLLGVGLINMNARLYDPKAHRFLSPDNFVQDPTNTQNYNRYGYCWNNPLRYSDPSGEFTWSDLIAGIAIVVGVVIVIASAGTLTPAAQYLIGAGVAHFLGTFATYMNNKEAGWDSASNYIGLSSPTISINTGWGDSNSDVNGVTQSEPVVTPIAIDDVRNMSSGNETSVNFFDSSPDQGNFNAVYNFNRKYDFSNTGLDFSAYGHGGLNANQEGYFRDYKRTGNSIYSASDFDSVMSLNSNSYNNLMINGIDPNYLELNFCQSASGSTSMAQKISYAHPWTTVAGFDGYALFSQVNGVPMIHTVSSTFPAPYNNFGYRVIFQGGFEVSRLYYRDFLKK